MTLDAKKFGLAGGILWGAGVFVLALMSMATGYADAIIQILASIYIGYAGSLQGAFIGLIWAFVDAFIGLWLFAKLYNWLG